MVLTTRILRSWTSRMTQVPASGSADADVVESAVVTEPALSTRSWRIRSWVSGSRDSPGMALGMVS